MKLNINYNKKLKTFAREHRNQSTQAEIKLWCELLRNKNMLGFPFLRQRPIGNYIVDFFCKDLNLAIETDGLSHHCEETYFKDLEKTDYLKNMGILLLRFQDEEVMNDIDNVRREIEGWINENKEAVNHPPTPFQGGLKHSAHDEMV